MLVRWQHSLTATVCFGVPLAILWFMAGPGMVSEAAGCSAMGPAPTAPGWTMVEPLSAEVLAGGPVVLSALHRTEHPPPAASDLQIVVTDGAGAPVAGAVSLIPLGGEPEQALVALWTPLGPLVVGESYTLTHAVADALAGQPLVSPLDGSADFAVVTPSSPRLPEVSTQLSRARHLRGEMLSCFDYKPCSLSPPYLTFGRDEGTRTTLKVALRRAPAPAHAWLVDVDGVAARASSRGGPSRAWSPRARSRSRPW